MEKASPRLAKPDFTAWFVLQAVLAAMHSSELDKNAPNDALPLYMAIAASASRTRPLSALIHALPYTWQRRICDFTTTPGRARHLYLRKLAVEKEVRALLNEQAIAQVIVLGAGLDILALRLAREYPSLFFIEIDQEGPQAFKQAALCKHEIVLPANLECLSGDLRAPLPHILTSSKNYIPHAKTLWIAEGLLMFIPEEGVRNIFTGMKVSSPSGSYCLFTSLPHTAQGSRLSRMIQHVYLKKERIAYSWAIHHHAMAEFLKPYGCVLIKQISYQELHTGHLNPGDPQTGEDLHLAQLR